MANEFKSRLSSLQSKLGATDALFLASGDEPGTPYPNFFYLTGIDIDGCALIATKNSSVILTSGMNSEYVKAKKPSSEVLVYKNYAQFSQLLSKQLQKTKNLKLDFGHTRLSVSDFLKKFTKAKQADASEMLGKARAIKSPSEAASIKKAIEITENIYGQLESELSEGTSEKQAAVLIQKMMLDAGVKPSFSPIVATGANSSYPHSMPTSAKIRGHVLVDIGVVYNHYCSDLTRCFFFPSGRMQKNAYDKLTLVTDELADRATSGEFEKALEFAKASEKLVAHYSLPKMIHSIGHGVGLEVHESPSLGIKSKDKFEKGMVIAIEPAAYFAGKFGVRHEVDAFL